MLRNKFASVVLSASLLASISGVAFASAPVDAQNQKKNEIESECRKEHGANEEAVKKCVDEKTQASQKESGATKEERK